MSQPLVVVGAGGFGREVIDVAEDINAASDHPMFDIEGVLDDRPNDLNLQRLAAREVKFLGAVDEYLASAAPANYVIGVGSPVVRRQLVEKFDSAGHAAVTLIHPSVTMGALVEIGAGVVVCAGVRITTNISIGRHVHINLNATVGHDTVIEDFVSISPLASVSGDCTIEGGATIGVNGVILQGLRVGHDSVVGGSACVVKDVPPEVVVKGVPAR